jgi:4-hydroxy-tetrahydrodipicolinate reductase
VPLDIILTGALGKMGKEIAEIIFSDSECRLAGAIEYPGHPCQGKDYGMCTGNDISGLQITSTISTIPVTDAVCIDFSSPDSLRNGVPAAAEKKIPLVIGTTGISDADLSFINSFSPVIPILVSPNMSLGVNLLFLLTEMVSKRLKDSYDIEIIEAHHRFKKDAPSGTAKRLGEIVASSYGLSYETCIRDGRKGISSKERLPFEVGMHAIRGGDIVGDHTVLFAGMGEHLELKHSAHDRSTFARGAVLAAKWLSKQNPGLYSMRNVLKL